MNIPNQPPNVPVAIDESGNSGNNLIIPHEPLLVLASVRLNTDQLREAEEHFKVIKAPEWKFTNFKKRDVQLKLLLQLLEKNWISSETVKIILAHKKFFAVSKFVDLLYEPLARASGNDLYEQGASLAIANFLVTMLPVYLGEDSYTELLASFVKLVREKDVASLADFREKLRASYDVVENLNPPDPYNILESALISIERVDLWLPYVSDNELDPLVPSYYTLIDDWGETLKSGFSVIADESKALKSQLSMIEKLSNPQIDPKKLPAVDNRWISFPLQSNSVTEVDSINDRSVQIADLLAGAANSVFSSIANHIALLKWQEAFKDLFFQKRLLSGGYWPSDKITPEELGAEHVVGEKPVDYTHNIIRKEI